MEITRKRDDKVQDRRRRRLVPRAADQLDGDLGRPPPDRKGALERVVCPLQPAPITLSLSFLLSLFPPGWDIDATTTEASTTALNLDEAGAAAVLVP